MLGGFALKIIQPFGLRSGTLPFDLRSGAPPFDLRSGAPPFNLRLGALPFDLRLGALPFDLRLRALSFDPHNSANFVQYFEELHKIQTQTPNTIMSKSPNQRD
jgi:hypothetical protein